MAQFGNIDQQNNAPIFSVDDKNTLGNTEFGSTVFGVDAAETGVLDSGTHSGWILRKEGYGPLTEITIIDGGTAYANTDTFSITSTYGANATGNIETDGSGVITSLIMSDYGNNFNGTEPVDITTLTGSTAVLNASYGGRAGRVFYETLVAGDISSDANDDNLFPDS